MAGMNELFLPDGYVCSDIHGSNSFVSEWVDKRSCPVVGISVVFSNSDGYSPTGTLIVQTSNALQQYGSVLSGAAKLNTSDAATFSGSSTSITAVGITKFSISTPDRLIRVKYTSSLDVAGLSVYIVGAGPMTTQ